MLRGSYGFPESDGGRVALGMRRRRREHSPPSWEVHQRAAAGSAFRGADIPGHASERIAGRDYNPDGSVAREWAADRVIVPPTYPPGHVTWHTFGPSGQTALPRHESGWWDALCRTAKDFAWMLPTGLLFAGATWVGGMFAGLPGALAAATVCTLILAWIANHQ